MQILPNAALLLRGNLNNLALQMHPLGDIAGDRRGADHVALCIFDWRDTQRDLDALAVLANPRRFEMLDRNALANAIELLKGLLVPFGRAKHSYFSANCFCRSVAIQPLCAGVPTHDYAVERLAENGVV